MSKIIDLRGQVFGRLTVIERAGSTKAGRAIWKCKCSCGNYTNSVSSDLRNGDVKSCGCYRHDIDILRSAASNKNTRLYRIWIAMKKRCYNKNDSKYKYYGEAGIDVCEDWRTSYKSFKEWSTSNGYAEDLTIDRIDVSRGYYPDNCRWVSMKVQSNNRSNNRIITYNGTNYTLAQLAEKFNLPYNKLYHRVITKSYDVYDAINELSA